MHNKTIFAYSHTQMTAYLHHHARTHTHTHLHTQEKTNEDCISFTRQCRQALIKHAWHVFPDYLPPHTHSHTQNNPNTGCRKYRFVLGWHAPSSLDRQLFYHTSHVNTVVKTYTQANVQLHLMRDVRTNTYNSHGRAG